jgi:hypothetical protein
MGSRIGGRRRWPTGRGGARYPAGAGGGGIRAGQWPEARFDGGTLTTGVDDANSEASAMCCRGWCLRMRCARSGCSHARHGGLPVMVAQQ